LRYLAGKTQHKAVSQRRDGKRLKSSGRLHSQETCMSQRGLEALLRPKSIAVIGASMKPDRAGYLMMRNLLAGDLMAPSCPSRPRIKPFRGAGMADVQSLPFVPDLAVLCTNAKRNPELLESLARKGVKPALFSRLRLNKSRASGLRQPLSDAHSWPKQSRPARPLAGLKCQLLSGSDPQRQTGVYLAVGCGIEHHPRLGAAA
jgi:predicted CoA-binding protein